MSAMSASNPPRAGRRPAATEVVKIGGMQCSFCVASLEKALRQIPGVSEAHVNIAHEEAMVRFDPSATEPSDFKRTVEEMGYSYRDPDKVRTFEEDAEELRAALRRLYVAGALTAATLALMGVRYLGASQSWFPWAMLALALTTMFGPGWPIKKMAWGSLRRGILNQHVLLELAAFGGLTGGLLGFVDSAFPSADFLAVATFVTMYHLLSGYASLAVRTKSTQAVMKLMALQPDTAWVVRESGAVEVPIAEVRVGDRVRVRPGDRVPVDGIVEGGRSSVDQSLVTGEPMPEEKGVGDEVIGGSINQNGTLLVRVSRVGAESFLQQVAKHVRESRALKPNIVILVDRLLAYFVPGVLVAAVAALGIWTAGAWLILGHWELTRAVFAALTVLVMGYPCALGMATPLAIIRGNRIAAEHGILMRSGEPFQTLRKVDTIVLDKTGTVTAGRPSVTEVHSLGGSEPSSVLRWTAAVEAVSEHPLARAIVQRAMGEGLPLPPQDGFEAYPGRGVTARVEGYKVVVGTDRFLREQGIDPSAAQAIGCSIEERGQTVVLVGVDGKLEGLVAVGDPIKADAREAVGRLRSLRLEPVLMTGDSPRTASAVASALGITDVRAGLLPQQKAEQVYALQAGGHRVAMVGDGINDAPALMLADVGVAIGTGTDIAIESADVVLVGARLSAVADAYEIARASYAKTVQNVAIAFAFNGIGIPLAMTGLISPIWAMVAMVTSVGLILANSFVGRRISGARDSHVARAADPSRAPEREREGDLLVA